MKITFKKDISLMDDEIKIYANKKNPEIEMLINKLSVKTSNSKIKGKHNETIFFLDLSDIYSFKIENRILYAYTDITFYTVKLKLYEIKEQLPINFIQISKSEIINVDYIHYLELENNGIIKIHFINNIFTHSSRRYLKRIKEALNL